jgi:hypothetical protein
MSYKKKVQSTSGYSQMNEDNLRNRGKYDRNEHIDIAKLFGLAPSNKLCDCCVGGGTIEKMKGETNRMLNQWQVLLKHMLLTKPLNYSFTHVVLLSRMNRMF